MLFKRKAFEKIGGYESVRSDIVDDVWIARKIKEYKLRLIVADGKNILECRMYESFRDIWEGFSKNIYSGLGYSIFLAFIIILLYLILFIFPFIFLIYIVVLKGFYDINMVLICSQVVLNYLMRFSLNFKFRLNIISDLLHPVGILMIVLIAFNSVRIAVFGQGPVWKGRTYSFKNK
jgi:chlorobactene glucosyltransferase